MAGLLAVLARTTGSGWLVVMASGLVPIFVIGAVAPIIPLSRARAALQLPADAMVGRTVAVTVTVEGRARGLTMRLREPASGWVHLDAPTSGTIPAVPSHRGVLASVVVELRSAAPFGLVVWQRKIVVPCPRPLDVAPVPIVGRAPITRADARGEASEGAGSRRGADSVRGIRPYAAGDPFRIVHWPATARWGGVMVRELDDDAPPDLVLVVDLSGGDLDATEARASLAAGLADDALASGRRVLLATVERAGPVTAVAETPTEVGRRLARAVSGEPVPPAIRSGDVVVRVARETALTER
jgi:uncharacterized protein (DUF58 family)